MKIERIMQADKPALNDRQKEARWMLYLSPILFLVGVVFLPVNVLDWFKSPHFLWTTHLVGDCGFILFGVWGFADARYTLRSGTARMSAARVVGCFLVLLEQVGRHTAQHQEPIPLWPWLLGALIFLMLFFMALLMFYQKRIRSKSSGV